MKADRPHNMVALGQVQLDAKIMNRSKRHGQGSGDDECAGVKEEEPSAGCLPQKVLSSQGSTAVHLLAFGNPLDYKLHLLK